MKNIVIFFPTDKIVSKAYEWLSESIENREMEMLSRFPQQQIQIFMARMKWSFHEGNLFTPDFQLIWESWEIYIWKKINADLVLGFRMPEGVSHKYPSNMRDICIDKSILENLFPEFTIKSIICNNYDDIQKNFHKILTKKKVLKPVSESGWRGIGISDKIPNRKVLLTERFPYLLQGFHDTSWGFYGLCSGTHDFRVVLLNGEIIWKILRQPKTWSFVFNTWSWGSLTDVWDFEIPENIMKIVKKIDTYCSRYTHRYYSIDMGLGKNWEIKVYELNSASALSNTYIAHKLWDYIVKNILKVS